MIVPQSMAVGVGAGVCCGGGAFECDPQASSNGSSNSVSLIPIHASQGYKPFSSRALFTHAVRYVRRIFVWLHLVVDSVAKHATELHPEFSNFCVAATSPSAEGPPIHSGGSSPIIHMGLPPVFASANKAPTLASAFW